MVIFNNCLNNGYFPNIWKLSKLYPLVKKPNDYDVNNINVQHRKIVRKDYKTEIGQHVEFERNSHLPIRF